VTEISDRKNRPLSITYLVIEISHRICYYTSAISKIATDTFSHYFNQWLILII